MKTVTIPERDELLTRLTAIADEPHLQAFHRVLAYNLAGKKVNGMGVANGLAVSMDVYTADHPTATTAAVRLMLVEFIPAFTDDNEVQDDARNHLRAAGFYVG